MKSYTPECTKIEHFAATLAPLKTYLLCVQDFDTKDYTLGNSIHLGTLLKILCIIGQVRT